MNKKEQLSAAFSGFGDITLQQIAHCHNDILGMIGHFYHRETDELKRLELEQYEKWMLTSSFLQTYAYLEEQLIDLHRIIMKTPLPQGSGLKRYTGLLQTINLDTGRCGAWSKLHDASEVRHCLLHANGRVDLMNSPDKLNKIISRYKELELHNSRVNITAEYLKKFIGQIHAFRSQILEHYKRGDTLEIEH
ncbi:hypothetical protein IOQ59_17300 [Pontibacterium sp. N1Y112]|uniref:Uncharacterized protein n=1 Tax=Pontibacterium sinense TaxID=2781979 RepID=A0A8J7JZN6_9GAMM|nr:hypothetical protein [Pontibacterium sinense]MBE9399018.1 hypothetical protein [Pontibacterium sinense]